MGWRFFFTLALAAPLAAQGPQQALAALVDNPLLADARVGVHVVDLESGSVVCSRDPDKGFMTASNMKLITSATALLTLGPDFRFETRLMTAGVVREGTLVGDLLLVGSGDPTLGGRQEQDGPLAVFERMAEELRDLGIRRVEGRVVGMHKDPRSDTRVAFLDITLTIDP